MNQNEPVPLRDVDYRQIEDRVMTRDFYDVIGKIIVEENEQPKITLLRGRYIWSLMNYTAILKEEGDHYLAQFDDQSLVHPETGVKLGFDWHSFPKGDFEIIT